MPLNDYIASINAAYKKGTATEHTYRTYLQTLVEELNPGISATNEPRRIACGAPDYIITKKDIPIGYIEAKDIGINLAETDKSIQLTRYKTSLDNLILTNYLNFIFYKDNKKVAEVSIGKVANGKITATPEKFGAFTNLLKEFCHYQGATIDSAQKLAVMMADKAKIMAEIINNALVSDEENEANSTLKEQLDAFRKVLIHDIKPKEFADVYAQTIAYGMFAARLHDMTFETFSRQEAAELIPKTNPFLRKLFGYIAGPDIDDRIKWVVDALADVFSYAAVGDILRNYGKETQTTDPIIHFYETFLAEYDPKLRKSRGVYYTPSPVVQFIVRAVDDILKTEFNLPMGLADTSKITVPVDKQGKKVNEKLHKVQILDPATGTGTFLAEVIRKVYENFNGQKGVWSKYVEEHLIPRVHGFELLMASYAMAHLKLDLLLKDTGYVPQSPQRLQVYLTNSLEKCSLDKEKLKSLPFSLENWLSQEASDADSIKNDIPVMVVLGNPPYSVSSSNMGDWIRNLIKDYKKDLKEKKLNLDDDYIKFIRYAQYYIEKNGQGIVAMITNNSFIDGITHRQMRKRLLEDFDKIYILDLHGNSKKKETALDGSKDENVFDIMQGVSINLFIKTSNSKKPAIVYHTDFYGKRLSKYHSLIEKDIEGVKWKELKIQEPYYFFVPKDFGLREEYEKGFKVDQIFSNYVSGFQTKRDSLTIQFDESLLIKIREDFIKLPAEELRIKYGLPQDGRDWTIKWAKEDIAKNSLQIINVLYRPFDIRKTLFTGKSKGFIAYPRESFIQHLANKENITLLTCRQESTFAFQHAFVCRDISDMCSISSQTKETGYLFPLYLYPDKDSMEKDRRPNFNIKIVAEMADKTGLSFTNEKTGKENIFAPIDILDYIYGVLYSPTYRETYKEFLKIDFPRVPYPKDAKQFFAVGKIGGELRELHLMEHPALDKLITEYPVDGNNTVEKVEYKDNKVYINKTQYFDKVPDDVWNFHIGGYQIAQKWLKDRKGRPLSYDDTTHYQRIIVALKETIRLMKEVDKLSIV